MKTISANANVNIEFSINLSLTLGEAQALEAIVGYGADAFLEQFYKLGKAYLGPHEDDMRALFIKARTQLPSEISNVKRALNKINEALSEIK